MKKIIYKRLAIICAYLRLWALYHFLISKI